MAKPTSKQELIDYALRQLGAPVLEINVADEQLDDIVDDAIQFFNERHYNGIERTYLKYIVSQDDIDRGRAGGPGDAGITTSTTSANIAGITSSFTFYENGNFLQVPDAVQSVVRVFKFDQSVINSGMFSIKYQLFLNDLYYFSSVELLHYTMVKSYLGDIDFILTPDRHVRHNVRQGRLYIDMDWSAAAAGTYIIIDCYRAVDPQEFTKIYNDSWLKRYVVSLIKRQWGQNLIKFQGVKLPGGIELNWRQLYDDAVTEITRLMDEFQSTYELPPMDDIG
jgi:hypothetical protein